MKNATCLWAVILLSSIAAFAIDPPVKLWEKHYSFPYHSGTIFRDIELTPDGNLFVTGVSTDFSSPDSTGYVAFLLDQEGNMIWKVDYTSFSMFPQDGTVLPDGSYAITGYGQVYYGSSRSLFIMKIDTDGSPEWTRIYDYPETKEEGYGITSLPDGGFAVVGRVHGTGSSWGNAWILRTDSQGDTLWTRTWGLFGTTYGREVIYGNNELCVLASGKTDSLPTYGPHLLFYDLDGNYLRGTDYPDLFWKWPAGICVASDGGYTFTTQQTPKVWHTDQYGETLWWQDITPPTHNGIHKGYGIRRTMDSGYIFCGWDGYYEWAHDGNSTFFQRGWLARFDSLGNELWNFNNATTGNNHFYSCLQLPEGGYIACGVYGVWEWWDNEPSRGSTGFLVRYAPETGISSPEPSDILSLELSPNPCSSFLSVSFSLPGQGNASVRMYDLSGRLVFTVAHGEFPAGSSTVQWSVPGELSSGCYLVQYSCDSGSITEPVVLIR